MNKRQGQPKALGVVALMAITLLLGLTLFVTVGTVGNSLDDPPPAVVFETEVDGETLTITHTQGPPVRTADLTVVLRQGGTDRRVPLSTVTNRTLSAGDTVSFPHALDNGEVTIWLIHEPTDGVFLRVQRTVSGAFAVTLDVREDAGTYSFEPTVSGGTPGAPAVRISDGALSGFAGFQDDAATGSVAVTDDGTGLRLRGNRWQQHPYDYYVTGDTVIEFAFRSDRPAGEIQGLALEDDNRITPRRSLRTFGTQNWGRGVRDVDGESYRAGDGWRTYRVEASTLPAFSAGEPSRIDRLVFVADDDADADADSWIRDVRLFESGADYQYRWTVNGVLVSNNPTLSRPLSDGDTVTLTVVDADGRTASRNYTVG